MRSLDRHIVEQLEALLADEHRLRRWSGLQDGASLQKMFGKASELLRLGIAWHLQEKRLGGLSRHARLALKPPTPASRPAAPPARKLTPGTRFVRDWHGTSHTVTVLDQGFEYENQRWSSLTSIAWHITGAKWSGPRFFGLTGAGA